MGKIVTFPREKHASGKQMHFSDMKSEEDRAILARILLENVARWVDDRDRDVIVGMDMGGGGGTPRPALTDEECAELAKAGAGSYGHCTIIEPADLDVYESYMYAPLAMPEKPEVMLSYWDMNRGVAPFMEGRVMVKALCPDGIESWLVISVPVPNFYTCVEGNCWGWPKYVCDEMTVEKDHSEVIYEGKVRLSMDFTPGGVDEAMIAKLKAQGTEGGNTISFAIDGGGGCLMRQGRGPVDTNPDRNYFVEWEAGMIKTFMRPEDKCSRLLPENCVTPGFWQWSIGRGGGPAGGMFKVTG